MQRCNRFRRGLFMAGVALAAIAGLSATASYAVQAAPAQNGFAKPEVRQAGTVHGGYIALVQEDFVPRSRNQPGGPLFG